VCRAMTADQLLRAKGEGETSLTNPNIKTRRRFRKLYVVATLHGTRIHGWSGLFVFVCLCVCMCVYVCVLCMCTDVFVSVVLHLALPLGLRACDSFAPHTGTKTTSRSTSTGSWF
jgi:hypothetical protein